MRQRFLCLLAGLVLIALAPGTRAQLQKERTLDEIKTEAIKRAENGMYPLIGLDPADVREAFGNIKTTDNDEWAAGFSAVADRYMTEGNSLLSSNPAQADKDFVRAWRLYSFGRWPVPASPGKKRAYAKALEAFLAHAKMMDPPLEVVHIPFEGSEIVGYLRLPKNAKGPVPVVIAISGLDSRKEDLTENFGVVLGSGIGYIGVDSPGTGQAPIKASETADRMFSKVIDYLQSRPEVDKTRIGVDGQSFGGYWATKLSIVEHARLKAVVAQSPPVDATFEKNFVLQKTLGNREYLFGLGPALMSIFEGANKIEDLGEILPKLSLVNQHLLGKPTTSMLIIAGALDTQVPISDAYLLLSSGDVPKEAWINPQGGHLGRQVKIWPDPVIFRKILVPWLVRNLEIPPPM
ncbi:MAG TPA: alpha/beta hydrolase [Candidatus Acidoferrales bacterium]|nr:alpha/beta hydrolase [Candidatus Acidoferrales bacterium]